LASSSTSRAFTLRERGDVADSLVAESRFLLATILRRGGEDPSRARALAERARASYLELGDFDEDIAEIDAWLAMSPDVSGPTFEIASVCHFSMAHRCCQPSQWRCSVSNPELTSPPSKRI
jgi:hypothetical protein